MFNPRNLPADQPRVIPECPVDLCPVHRLRLGPTCPAPGCPHKLEQPVPNVSRTYPEQHDEQCPLWGGPSPSDQYRKCTCPEEPGHVS